MRPACPAARSSHVDEVFADPQVRHLGIATPVEHPKLGEIRVVGQAAKLSRTPARIEWTLPPAGANNADVLRDWLAMDAAGVDALRAAGAI